MESESPLLDIYIYDEENEDLYTFNRPIGTMRFTAYKNLYKCISVPVRKDMVLDGRTE